MAGKYGSASAWLLVDGYNLLAAKLQTLRHKIEAITEKTDGLGDAYEAHTPVGVTRLELEQGGAFFDTDTNNIHDAMAGSVPTSPQASTRVVCLGFEGQVTGARFYGLSGPFSVAYEVLAQLKALTKANVQYLVSGRLDKGEIVQPLATKAADWQTESTSVDHGASSANGAVGYQQVTALAGFTGFVGKLRDSADNVTFADLIDFDNVTSAPNVQRKTVAGTVDRYVAYDGNVTGTGSITVWAGNSRQ